MARLFISQERLDSWSAESRVVIEGDTMLLVDAGRSFIIRPAVRFMSVAGDDPDAHNLLGTVADEEKLAAMGADHMATSVICGDTAYEVQCGFLGDPRPTSGGQ